MNDSNLEIIKGYSVFDEEKREYELAPFLVHEESVVFPKGLKNHEIEDLWKERQAKNKVEILPLDLPEIEKNSGLFEGSEQSKLANLASPFIQSRKIFKLPDYKDPIYR